MEIVRKQESEPQIVQIDSTPDIKNIVDMSAEVLGCSKSEALTKLIEVGIINVLNYPLGNPLFDDIMARGNFPLLTNKIKAIWGM